MHYARSLPDQDPNELLYEPSNTHRERLNLAAFQRSDRRAIQQEHHSPRFPAGVRAHSHTSPRKARLWNRRYPSYRFCRLHDQPCPLELVKWDHGPPCLLWSATAASSSATTANVLAIFRKCLPSAPSTSSGRGRGDSVYNTGCSVTVSPTSASRSPMAASGIHITTRLTTATLDTLLRSALMAILTSPPSTTLRSSVSATLVVFPRQETIQNAPTSSSPQLKSRRSLVENVGTKPFGPLLVAFSCRLLSAKSGLSTLAGSSTTTLHVRLTLMTFKGDYYNTARPSCHPPPTTKIARTAASSMFGRQRCIVSRL